MKYSEDFYDTPYTPFRLHVSRPNYYRLIFSHQQLCRSIQFRPSPDCHSQVSNVISTSGNILGIRRMLARIFFFFFFFFFRFIARTLRSIFNCVHFSNSLFPPILLSSSLPLLRSKNPPLFLFQPS